MEDLDYMFLALEEAKKSLALQEVPIGCVVVREGIVIGSGHNVVEKEQNPLAHAEVIAINEARKHLSSWRVGGSLYVTVEPCPMCMGAIINARISRLVIGAKNPRFGASGSVVDLSAFRAFNHRLTVDRGVLEAECGQLMRDFFKQKRR